MVCDNVSEAEEETFKHNAPPSPLEVHELNETVESVTAWLIVPQITAPPPIFFCIEVKELFDRYSPKDKEVSSFDEERDEETEISESDWSVIELNSLVIHPILPYPMESMGDECVRVVDEVTII